VTGITISGLASGLDTDSIISQLMSIERQPRTRVARQQMTVQARQDALRQIDTKLTNLKLAAGDLRSAVLWSPTQTVSSGNEGVLTARQVSGAGPGGYSVTVGKLATAQSATYAWDGAAGGELSIDYATGGQAQSAWKHTFDPGASIDDVVAEVNGDSTAPVWAVNVDGKLSLTRRVTGDNAWSGFSVTAPQVTAPPVSTRAGSDASYTIDGDATVYSSHTNVATGGLPGVELTLKSLGTASVNVSPPAADPSKVSAKLQAFVSAYNDAVGLVRAELSEKPVANPQTDTDAKRGVLFGDTALSGVLSQLRQSISSAGLDALGIKVADSGTATDPDSLAGKLTFDQDTFDTAWAKSPLDVQAKLGSPDGPGFAQAFEGLLDPVTRAGDGLLDQRVASADRELGSIKDNLARIDDRLQTKEDYLRAQFTALEEALSKNQSQSSDLTSQLAQLSSSS